jgi:RHS repeat-associated protein
MVAMRTTATATLTYLHGDHLGSTSLTTNAGGQKVSEQRYKPYGEVRWSSGAGMPTDFTFTGQRAGSYGTIFMSAREYLPSLGRFLSANETNVPCGQR